MLQTQLETKVVIYCRVSTKEQGDSGLGLEAQESICRAVAASHGWYVVCVVREVCGGSKHFLKRKELVSAVSEAHKQGAALLVKDISRLTRDMMLGQEYVNGRIFGDNTPQLVLADNPSHDQFYLDLMLSFAAQERRLIGKRTREGLQALRERGGTPGKDGGQARHEKAKAATKEAIRLARIYRSKGWALTRIADELNAKGHKTSTGGLWTQSKLWHWLNQPQYIR